VHLRFGAIPMIEVTVAQPNGVTYVSRADDPSYAPSRCAGRSSQTRAVAER
jgi:hypothetical protein